MINRLSDLFIFRLSALAGFLYPSCSFFSISHWLTSIPTQLNIASKKSALPLIVDVEIPNTSKPKVDSRLPIYSELLSSCVLFYSTTLHAVWYGSNAKTDLTYNDVSCHIQASSSYHSYFWSSWVGLPHPPFLLHRSLVPGALCGCKMRYKNGLISSCAFNYYIES